MQNGQSDQSVKVDDFRFYQPAISHSLLHQLLQPLRPAFSQIISKSANPRTHRRSLHFALELPFHHQNGDCLIQIRLYMSLHQNLGGKLPRYHPTRPMLALATSATVVRLPFKTYHLLPTAKLAVSELAMSASERVNHLAVTSTALKTNTFPYPAR